MLWIGWSLKHRGNDFVLLGIVLKSAAKFFSPETLAVLLGIVLTSRKLHIQPYDVIGNDLTLAAK